MNRQLAIALLLVLVSCGGTAALETGANSCTITISGGVTASVTQECVASAAINTDTGKADFGVSAQGTAIGSLVFAAKFTNSNFSNGSYDTTSLAESNTSMLYPASSENLWEESSGATGSTPAAGTASLVISSTGTQVSDGKGGTAWVLVHGTLDATLPPFTGNPSTTNVTLHMVF